MRGSRGRSIHGHGVVWSGNVAEQKHLALSIWGALEEERELDPWRGWEQGKLDPWRGVGRERASTSVGVEESPDDGVACCGRRPVMGGSGRRLTDLVARPPSPLLFSRL